jgi:UDP-MurNAc hydroxylase
MRVTSVGHAGLFVETRGGSVLCDPWFTPAYFGSWFPFPRNDVLDPATFASPDYLYVSHLHRDHFDPDFLARHVDKRARVLLPAFRVPFLEDALRVLGFTEFVRTRHGRAVDLGGLEVTLFAMTAPADGPLGDSAIVIADDTARVLNQNDARPGDPAELEASGPFDADFLQFSGASWYPVVYDFPPAERSRLASEKRANGLDRAERYVRMMHARHVFPSAGPPCFLDDDLWELNDFDRADDNIFPDQTVWLERLTDVDAHLVVPGTVVELAGAKLSVHQPATGDELMEPFTDKRAYLEQYRADWKPWLAAEHDSWSHGRRDVVSDLREWFEPLLVDAPLTRSGIGGSVLLHLGDVVVVIDFVHGDVREWDEERDGDAVVYRIDVERALVEACIERRLDDWVNSLLLSCRFRAHRNGPFNEYVHTFFKSLSPERMAYVERSYRDRLRQDETFECDGWRLQRRCPHRQADLTRFGTITDGVLHCSVHDWEWDLATGRCLTSAGHELRAQPADEEPADPGAGAERSS